MADDKGRESAGAASSPQPGAHMVQCVKFGREMPGLDRVPWKGEIGKRVYDNVSKEAWRMWVEHSKMPPEPARSELVEDYGRPDGAVFLW